MRHIVTAERFHFQLILTKPKPVVGTVEIKIYGWSLKLKNLKSLFLLYLSWKKENEEKITTFQ